MTSLFVVGDSFSDDPSTDWAAIMAEQYGYEMDIDATGGYSTTDILARLYSQGVSRANKRFAAADIAVVFGGTNDVLQNHTLETFEANVREIYDKFFVHGLFIVVNLPPFGNHVSWTAPKAAARVEFNARLDDETNGPLSWGTDVRVFDVATIMADVDDTETAKTFLTWDGLHPTEAGVFCIAASFHAHIKYWNKTIVPAKGAGNRVSIPGKIS